MKAFDYVNKTKSPKHKKNSKNNCKTIKNLESYQDIFQPLGFKFNKYRYK